MVPLVLAGCYKSRTVLYPLLACLAAVLRLVQLRAWPVKLQHIHHLAVMHIWHVVPELSLALHSFVYAVEVDYPGVIQQAPERQAGPPVAEVLRDREGDGGDEARRDARAGGLHGALEIVAPRFPARVVVFIAVEAICTEPCVRDDESGDRSGRPLRVPRVGQP